jgi:serine/threonine-protein kinase
MGTVYESWDTRLERYVAVKVIRPDLMETPDATRRFRREARAAARLSHPNVVALYDFGVADDDRAYIVMERLRGRSLREELQEHGAIERARTLRILRGIGAAVALAHERGIVHRDLKPENIFLTCDEGNEAEIAKILDFGLAKSLFPDASATATQTVSGTIMGTLAYMSPEQQRGGVPSAAWDTWALTVVAFEMLTGAHPFAGTGVPVTSGLADATGRITATPVLPADVASCFERALSADPGRRPSSVTQFLEELEGLRASDAGEVRL